MRRLSQILSIFLVIALPIFIGCEGPSGTEGPQGPEGPVGPAGEDGSMIYSGQGAPDADIGEIDDYYLDTDTGEMYGPKDEDGWGDPIIVLMGEDGKDGTDGSQIHSDSGAPGSDTGDIGDFYFDESSGEFYGPKTEDGWGSPTDLTGEDGQDGEDGSQIHSGSGAPGSDTGNIGDFYFDESSGEFYGPKTEDGWGSPTDLTGEDGQDGEDGSQIYSGSGTPDSELGAVGDYYLDKDNYDLYGPKTSSGWGTPLNLKGADGNANVTRYIFPGHDFVSDADASLSIDIESESEMQENVWLIYISNSSYYPVPGRGPGGNSVYRTYHFFSPSVPPRVVFWVILDDGPGEEYDQIEIVRIEASNTEDHTKRAGEAAIIPEDLDVSDYEAVAEYYGFYRE